MSVPWRQGIASRRPGCRARRTRRGHRCRPVPWGERPDRVSRCLTLPHAPLEFLSAILPESGRYRNGLAAFDGLDEFAIELLASLPFLVLPDQGPEVLAGGPVPLGRDLPLDPPPHGFRQRNIHAGLLRRHMNSIGAIAGSVNLRHPLAVILVAVCDAGGDSRASCAGADCRRQNTSWRTTRIAHGFHRRPFKIGGYSCSVPSKRQGYFYRPDGRVAKNGRPLEAFPIGRHDLMVAAEAAWPVAASRSQSAGSAVCRPGRWTRPPRRRRGPRTGPRSTAPDAR